MAKDIKDTLIECQADFQEALKKLREITMLEHFDVILRLNDRNELGRIMKALEERQSFLGSAFERSGYEDNRVYAQQQPLAIEVKVHRDEKHRSTSL